MALSVVVAGGHSAGHIEPAMNVADAIRVLDPTAAILAIGTERGLDTTLIPARGYDLELIPPVPLSRKPNLALLRTPSKLIAAVRAAGLILDRVHADVLLGFGGYVAVPSYLAARRRGIPIVVHEANGRPGVANRLAARLTRDVFTASEGVRLRHGRSVGIPLRPAIVNLDRASARHDAAHRLGLDPSLRTVLVTGGSQGAQRINVAAYGAAAEFAAAGIQVLHIAGPRNPLAQPHRSADQPPYLVMPYLDTMADAYAAADFVLARCGAMTCAELAAVGLPAGYVPLPLRGGEQARNADSLVRAGAALIVADADCTPEWVAEVLIGCVNDDARLQSMTEAAKRSARPEAATVIARRVLDLAQVHSMSARAKSNEHE